MNPEEKVNEVITEYAKHSGLSKKEILRKFVAVFNVRAWGFTLIQKKNLCPRCKGDGAQRCSDKRHMDPEFKCNVCDENRLVTGVICNTCDGH